jgi:hypothetical protein
MQVQAFERRVEELIVELASFSGYRTLWLDRDNRICHAEPEHELEDEGFLYLATLMQPGRDTLTEALAPRVPLELPNPGIGRWRSSVATGFEAGLIAAQA